MKYIPLTQGKSAIVDDEDYETLAIHKWTLSSSGYAYRQVVINGKATSVWMHRVITQAPRGMDVDHINGDGVDNCRSNLRVCSHSENIRNQQLRRTSTSGYKGVSFYKRDGTWSAHIRIEGKKRHLGYFKTPEQAALTYDAAARLHYGAFARVNFPEQDT